jgi:hypothetical protein
MADRWNASAVDEGLMADGGWSEGARGAAELGATTVEDAATRRARCRLRVGQFEARCRVYIDVTWAGLRVLSWAGAGGKKARSRGRLGEGQGPAKEYSQSMGKTPSLERRGDAGG